MSKEQKVEKQSKSSRLKLKRSTRRAIFGLLIFLILISGFVFGQSVVYAQKILPKTSVGGVDISGLSKTDALKKIETEVDKVKTVHFSYKDKSWEFSKADLGIVFDVETSIEKAWSLGKSGSISQRVKDQVKSLFVKSSAPFKFVIDEEKYLAQVDKNLAKELEDPQLETQLLVKNGEPQIIPGQNGLRMNRQNLIDQTKSYLEYPTKKKQIQVKLEESKPLVSESNAQKSRTEANKIIATNLKLKAENKDFDLNQSLIGSWVFGKVVEDSQKSTSRQKIYTLTADIDRKKVTSYIDAIADEVNKEPSNARISMNGDQLTILEGSSQGLSLEKEDNVNLIIKTLLDRVSDKSLTEIDLVVTKIDPDIDTDKISSLGIKELLGRAGTNFSGSPQNRIHNIGVGANLLSSAIIKDGEEFSALKLLGKVEESQGFLPELVIQNNKLENQLGGGLCQNATTLFRAALDAGLPITARQNHSRRVSYYEKPITGVGVNIVFDGKFANIGSMLVGYDATVFVPQPDLKFKNNTGNAILVQEYVRGNIVYAEIFGTKDGRTPTISKAEVLLTKPIPTPIYHNAPELPAGTNTQIVKGVPGAKTKFTYTIKYSNGQEEPQDFISYYRAITPEIKVGSAVIAQPAPEAPPTQ